MRRAAARTKEHRVDKDPLGQSSKSKGKVRVRAHYYKSLEPSASLASFALNVSAVALLKGLLLPFVR